MKTSIVLLSCCVAAACCCAPSEVKERADASLALAVRLEKAGVDTTDLSILEPAMAYYASGRDESAKRTLWYHRGRIHFNRAEYGEAAVCFGKSLEAAAAIGDSHGKGLALRGLADTYGRTFNAREDSLHLRKALDAFEEAGDTLFAAEVKIRLAVAFTNDRRWEKAERLYRESLDSLRNSRLRARCLSCYGSFLLDAPTGDAALALRCLEEALSLGEKFSPQKWADWGYALQLNGREEEGNRVWTALEAGSPDPVPALDYWRYRLAHRRKDYGEALSSLIRRTQVQDSLFRMQASQAVSRAQQDYLSEVAARERLEKEHERLWKWAVFTGAVLLTLILLLMGKILLQREKDRRVAVQQALCDSQKLVSRLSEAEQRYRERIHSLHRDVRTRDSALADLRTEYLYLFRNGYRRLGKLFEEVRFADTQKCSEAVLYRRIRSILKEIDGDKNGLRQLVKFIDRHLDRCVTRLRQDLPALKEQDIRLFCYLVIGYDASLISMLMGIGNLNTVYSRKGRLTDKIRKLPPSKAGRYLELIA